MKQWQFILAYFLMAILAVAMGFIAGWEYGRKSYEVELLSYEVPIADFSKPASYNL